MILEARGITKIYSNGRGIKNIELLMEPGEVLGLLGPNGSGKTTSMKIISGLIVPDEGTVTICGFDALRRHERAMAKVGCLIESPALIDYMTALANMKLAARFYKSVDSARIDDVLRLCGIEKYKKDKVGTFSLGMRQRLGLALALLSSPEFLILDEPANGLDIEGMVSIREIVKNAAAGGAAVLISSHLAHEIELCATRVAIVYDGELLRTANMSEVLECSPTLEDFFLAQLSEKRKGGT